jgi:hypothetical protein
MNVLIKLWLSFLTGMAVYWLKRAYYGINPPSPVATGYYNYLQRSWAPLLVRAFIDSVIFWLLFTPGLADKALGAIGWTNYAWVVMMITQFAPVAALFGFFVDSVVDFAVTKIPYIKDILPQMPGPLPQPAIVQAQIVEQKVTQLQTTTTVVPGK